MTRDPGSALPMPDSLTTWENVTNVRPPHSGQTAGGVDGYEGADVNIVHDAPPRRNPSPELERMARADGCPECAVNVEIPRSVVDTTTGFRAAYLCGHCGHAWTTDWMED